MLNRRNKPMFDVSVLFSEPKIPQWFYFAAHRRLPKGFSALQRAENSSICAEGSACGVEGEVSVLFSEPKIPQSNCHKEVWKFKRGFSALQRAENSSIYMAGR